MTLELLWQREEEIRERNQQDKRRKGETQKCRKRPKRKTHDLSLSDHHEKKNEGKTGDNFNNLLLCGSSLYDRRFAESFCCSPFF